MRSEIRNGHFTHQCILAASFANSPRRGAPLYGTFFEGLHLIARFAELYIYFELLLAAIDGDLDSVACAVVVHDLG